MDPSLTLEAVTLLVVLCNSQSTDIFNIAQIRKSSKYLIWNTEFLSSIAALASCYQVSSFISRVIEGFLIELGQEKNLTNYLNLSQFLAKLIEEVRFIGNDSIVIIKYESCFKFLWYLLLIIYFPRSFICGYLRSIQKVEAEVIEKQRELIKSLLDRLEKQYPVDFERALHIAMTESAEVPGQTDEIRNILGTNWDVDHTSLFLKLNHVSPEVRLKAVKSVVNAVLEKKVIASKSFALID